MATPSARVAFVASTSLLIFAACAASGSGQVAAPPIDDAQREQAVAAEAGYVRTVGRAFVDPAGRQLLLHGVNVVSKSPQENYLSWHGPAEFAALRAWGMNCIRLGILWDGVEPSPGRFDDRYLDGVAERIAWAEAQGLYVILDMHQDLFSVLYSDGAPAWATLHDDQPHTEGAVWSDAYLSSQAVQRAFDNFWDNRAAPDGVGLQEHYAAAWRHVAQRFADSNTVLGYDLMNEPFQGSSVVAAQAALKTSPFAAALAARLGDAAPEDGDLERLWFDPAGRTRIMTELSDPQLYAAFVAVQEPFSQQFERDKLQPLLQRVADAIRTVDRRHIMFLEPSYHCNSGAATAIAPLRIGTSRRDPQQAFAPHGYDLVVDTASLAEADAGRVKFIFQRLDDAAARLDLPLVIGEWGAFGDADQRILPSARVLQQTFEQLRCGDLYWDYGRGLDRQAYFSTLRRSLPLRIAGELLEYRCDPDSGEFVCRWRERPEVVEPTVIYLTAATLAGRTVRLTPPGDWRRQAAAADGAADFYLSVAATGASGERTLTIAGPRSAPPSDEAR